MCWFIKSMETLMGPRTRTALALLATVVVCANQWMFGGTPQLASIVWPLAALALLAGAMALNASEMRAAGIPIGFSHGRKLPTAGLNLACVATLLIALVTLARYLPG